jgi:hypothetical protein
MKAGVTCSSMDALHALLSRGTVPGWCKLPAAHPCILRTTVVDFVHRTDPLFTFLSHNPSERLERNFDTAPKTRRRYML